MYKLNKIQAENRALFLNSRKKNHILDIFLPNKCFMYTSCVCMCLYVSDLCHQSWQSCWGRSFVRARRAQVEESLTLDGK